MLLPRRTLKKRLCLGHNQFQIVKEYRFRIAVYYPAMDSSIGLEAKTRFHDSNLSLEDRANVSSFMTFSFLNRVFFGDNDIDTVVDEALQKDETIQGFSQQAIAKKQWFAAIGSVSTQDRIDLLYHRMSIAWKEETESSTGPKGEEFKVRSLWRPLWKVVGFYRRFLVAILLYASYTAISLGPIMILNRLVTQFESDRNGSDRLSTQELWICVALLFVLPLIASFFAAHSNAMLVHIGLQFRNTLMAMIFRKSFVLSPTVRQQVTAATTVSDTESTPEKSVNDSKNGPTNSDLPDPPTAEPTSDTIPAQDTPTSPSTKTNTTTPTTSTSTGQIVSMFTNDCQQIQRFMQFTNNLLLAFPTIVVCIALIYLQVGVSVFVGVGVIFIIVPCNIILFGYFAKLRRLKSIQTDHRIKIMNELLHGLRVIKYYAWEYAFAQKVSNIRSEELNLLKQSNYANTMAVTLILQAIPIVLPVIIFYVYVKLGNQLTIAKAFTTISLFNVMQFPFAFLPYGKYLESCTHVYN